MQPSLQMSNSDILHLIKCPKVMNAPIPAAKTKNRNYEQRFSVYSDDYGEFKIFITQSIPNPIDFSVGLMFNDFLLLRCNGFHGPTRIGSHQYTHHAAVHTHTLTENDIHNGRDRRPSEIEDVTGKYFDVKSALRYFCEKCGIMNYADFAPELAQISLFEGEGNWS